MLQTTKTNLQQNYHKRLKAEQPTQASTAIKRKSANPSWLKYLKSLSKELIKWLFAYLGTITLIVIAKALTSL